MPASPRSTISLPSARIEQLAAIAQARGLPNPAAVIESWINRSVAEGEIPPGAPGYYASRVGNDILVSIAGHVLPLMTVQKARTLAVLLSAASGGRDPEIDFQMPAGRPVALDIGQANIAIGKAGRGVRIVVKPADGSESAMIATSPAFVADLAEIIRATITGAH